MKSAQRELEDIVFIEADSRWLHYPHNDALFITTQIANSNIHIMLVDNGNAVDIIYLDGHKRMGLNEGDLSPTTTPLYWFTRDHVISKGRIKLVVTVGEHPRASTLMTKFLIVDYLSAFNGVIGRLFLKALKAMTSRYHLIMKFPTAEGTGQVRGSQYN